jgi:hypothetical protein
MRYFEQAARVPGRGHWAGLLGDFRVFGAAGTSLAGSVAAAFREVFRGVALNVEGTWRLKPS